MDRIKTTVAEKLAKPFSKDERDKLWSFLKERVDDGLEARRPYEQRWIVNLSFLAGRQYVFFNQSAHMLQALIQRKNRLRIVDNKLLPRYRKQISRLIRTPPIMSVVPSTTEREDIEAAKIGDKALKHIWAQTKMRAKIMELGGWIYSVGNGFLDDRWNPKLGPTKFNPENGTLEYMGDVDVGVWSPFEIIVPAFGLGDTDLHRFPWLAKAKFRPLEYIEKNYIRGAEVKEESRALPYTDMSMLWGMSTSAASAKQKGATLIELYVQPCGEYPEGLFLVGANGIILEQDKYPFDFYHLEQFKDNEIPGVFWGMATIEAAIWLQKLWNRTLSDVAEFNRSMARGKWLIPRQSKMEVLPDDSHGQTLLYTPVLGHKPEMLDLKGLPATYMQILELVATSLMELFHQHEVTQGTNRSDIRSGDMVSLLLEADDWGNIPTHAIFEEKLECVMRRVLQRIQKGYTEERVLQIVGRDGEHEIISFKGSDLRNNTDVSIRKDSSLPQSRSGRQVAILQRYQMGLYGDPREPGVRERVNLLLDEVPDTMQDLYAEMYLDRTNARIENKAIFNQPGIQLVANPYDDHAIHLEEHRKFKKGVDYQKLKLGDPRLFGMLDMAFMQHELQHQAFLAEAEAIQMKKIAQMNTLQGKGGKTGG